MNETPLTDAMDELIDEEMADIDRFIKEEIEPLGDFGNPEKLIGKPYETWTPQEKQILAQIYGPEPNALSNLIFRKEYEKMLALEAEVESNG